MSESKSFGIEHVGALVGACTAIALVLSVCYDLGFFKAVGLDFRQVPTSIADHVRTGIIWGPGLAAGFVLAFVWRMSDRVPDELQPKTRLGRALVSEPLALLRLCSDRQPAGFRPMGTGCAAPRVSMAFSG